MRFRAFIVAAFLVAPAILPAQSLLERLESAPNIGFSEWQEMTSGKTVVYEIDNETYAFEAYRRNSNRITIRLESGECIDGTWHMEGPSFCFDWEIDVKQCFRHVRLGDDIYVFATADFDIQKVVRIEPLPLFCGPALLSQLQPEVNP